MKRITTLLLAIGAALALAGCGGDDSGDDNSPDASLPSPDAGETPDAGNPIDTLEEYVIDLVENQTADNTDPAAYAEFSALPDTATETSYGVLFQ